MTKSEQLVISAIKETLVLVIEGNGYKAEVRLKELGGEIVSEFLDRLSLDHRPRDAGGRFVSIEDKQ